MADNKLKTSLDALKNEKVCSPFSLSSDPANTLMAGYVEDHLNIGGAQINVFKLLGIHEQGRLVDLTGNGTAISSGEYPQFPATNAFTDDSSEWRSTQKGDLVTKSAFIGYDFGPIKLDNGRERYGIETSIKQHITTIKIRQSCVQTNRATKIRVERSDDNNLWYGVAIVDLPDDGNDNQVSIKQSAPARYWRLRPVKFNGNDSDFWSVMSLELTDFQDTQLNNIQEDDIFLESRDRCYSKTSFAVKGFYELQEPLTYLARFGMDMNDVVEYVMKVAFSTAVRVLGRPIVIGDIVELPSETQYTPELKPIKKYLEVTDVSWASEGFTPGWVPTIQRVVAKPMLASQETRDIVGDINLPNSVNNFSGLDDSLFNIEALISDQRIKEAANTQVPEAGGDIVDVRQFSADEVKKAASSGIDISKLNIDPRSLYIEDGLPPNGLPYTEGPKWPNSPKDGDYHRLTYEGLSDPIPPRLYKFSIMKNRWVFVEEDKRARYNVAKPALQEFLKDPNRIPADKIVK